jgi:hypothetical protein
MGLQWVRNVHWLRLDPRGIPWNKLSFTVITETLRHFLQDCVNGQFSFGVFDIPVSKLKDRFAAHPHSKVKILKGRPIHPLVR